MMLILAAGERAQAQTAYALHNGGDALVRFDLATPGLVTTIGNFSGAAISLRGLDYRPADGQLYGYSAFPNQLVTIDPNTAATTFVSTPTTVPNPFAGAGVDFNPVADRLRLVNAVDQNLRINVDSGATTVDSALAYAAADPNFGVNPVFTEVAYINNDNDPVTGTQLYYIDTGLSILATTSNPNGGVLKTVGNLGVSINDLTGFDIFTTSSGANAAYALLTQGSTTSLYTINLGTGAATLVGPLPATGFQYFGLAITPVPEPTSLALVMLSSGTMLFRGRRRR